MPALQAIQNISLSEQQHWIKEIETCLSPEYHVEWNPWGNCDLEVLFSKIQNETCHILVIDLHALPVHLPKQIKIVALSSRTDNQEHIWCHKDQVDITMDFRMKEKTKIFTADTRQKYQILSMRPDLEIVHKEDLADAIISPIILSDPNWSKISLNPKEFIPAPGSGVAAILTHAEDTATIKKLKSLHHKDTAILTNIERKILKLNNHNFIEILGVYCTITSSNHYQVYATAKYGEKVLSTRIFQSTNHGLAEKVLESFYNQI